MSGETGTALDTALGIGRSAELHALGGDLRTLAELAELHRRLWDLEDRARSQLAGDTEIATVKRAIDERNGRRHRLIDRFDAGVRTPLPVEAHTRHYSETFGELCDRLLIIALKLAHAELGAQEADLAPTARERCRAAAERLRRWQSHLHQCLHRQLVDVHAGRAALPPRSEFKMYNDPELNPVTRAES